VNSSGPTIGEPAKWRTGARALYALALFTFPASMIVVPKVPGVATAFLLVGSLALAPFAFARRAELSRREDYAPLLGLFVFLALGAAHAAAAHAPTWLLINYGRLFAALAIPAAIRLLEPPEWVFYAGCAVGALLAGGYAVAEIFGQGAVRASGPDIYFGWRRATIFGGLAVMLAFVPILAAPEHWPRAGKVLLIAGLVGGITAAALSGSRSAWLAASLLAVWRVARARAWAAAILLVLIVAASVVFPLLAERWNAAFGDVMSYEEGQAQTSLGLRFDMWKAALAAFAENPLFGVGPMGFRDVLAARVEAGLGSASLAEFEHAHSDALHALATGGLAAFAGLLAAYWLPWRYFRRMHARHGSAAARAGMALVVTFVILGLTDTMFVHRIALSAYVIGIAALLGYAGLPSAAARSLARERAADARAATARLQPVDPP